MRKSQPVLAYPEGLIQCENCEVWFVPSPRTLADRQRFCSDTCRWQRWTDKKRERESAAS